MKTKIIPFDAKMAKDIQDGKIQGKIKYTEDDSYVYNAEIIKFDLIADKFRAKPNSTLFRSIIAIVDFDDRQAVRTFNSDGYGCSNDGGDTKLLIEVSANESNEPQFKPFDKVLVRNEDNEDWETSYFSHIRNACGMDHYVAGNLNWKQCIPYEGNEHLVGTTDKPKEE